MLFVLSLVFLSLSGVAATDAKAPCIDQSCKKKNSGTYLLQRSHSARELATTFDTLEEEAADESEGGQSNVRRAAARTAHKVEAQHAAHTQAYVVQLMDGVQYIQNESTPTSCSYYQACRDLALEGECCPHIMPDNSVFFMSCCPQAQQPLAYHDCNEVKTPMQTPATTPAPSVTHTAEPEPEAEHEDGEPEPEAEPESEGEAADAQFLIQASFGPNVEALAELSGMTMLDWVRRQMELPVTSHRAWFRERVNSPYRGGLEGLHETGILHGPCKAGSRWNTYALSQRDEGKSIEVKGGTEIWIDGKFRTGIRHGAFSTRWTALTDWSGYICIVFETPGGDVRIGTDTRCNGRMTMPNPPPFMAGAPNVSLDLKLVKTGAGVIMSEMTDCQLTSPEWDVDQPIIVQSYGAFHIYDPRYELRENTPESPSNDKAACPEKHALNEKHCALPVFEESNTSVPGWRAEVYRETGNFPSSLEDTSVLEEYILPSLNYPSSFPEFSVSRDFSAKFSGELIVTEPGFYFFYLESDDGSKLWINQQEVVDNGGWHGMYEKEGYMNLEKGAHDIVVEFYQGGGGLGLKVSYLGPDTNSEKRIIPETAVQTLPLSFTGCLFSCGSPGEVANKPAKGHHMPMQLTGRRRRAFTEWNYDNKYYRYWQQAWSKQAVWINLALTAPDQLRQRMAWALSQIFVVSEQGQADTHLNEMWLHYYDIFVHNAFGSFWDILTSVTFSPLMGRYLTHTGSSSLDYNGMYPNENYAREVMQLFTIGLDLLHPNGTAKVDSDGNALPTYDQRHILNFARVFTGFENQPIRHNIETGSNIIDPMRIDVRKHDVHPKPDLEGNYIGDGFPLCTDTLPPHSYLVKGARYEFKGPYGNGNALALQDGSALLAALCGGASTAADCSFSAVVTLPETVDCTGQEECETGAATLVRIGDNMHYSYKPPVCVHPWIREATEDESSLFNKNPRPTPGYCVDSSGRNQNSGVVKLDSKDEGDGEERKQECLNLCLEAGGTGCEMLINSGHAGCYVHTFEVSNGQGRSGYWCWSFSSDTGKKGRSYMIVERGPQSCPSGTEIETVNECRVAHESLGLPVGDPWVGLNTHTPQRCSFNGRMHWQYGDGREATWMKTICRAHVTVDADGEVADGISRTTFNPPWVGGQPAAGIKPVSLATSAPFTSIPSSSELAQLKVGAYPPTNACSAGCKGDVKAYYGPSGSIDKDTVFEYDGKFFKNLEMMVVYGETESKFRNPPIFMRTTEDAGAERSALTEIMTLLEYLYHHSNTPVFIAKRLIQRFVTSNPAPHYVQAVSEAFSTGSFGGSTFSGKYGDLAATIAAILLHPAARNINTNAGVSYNGALREPILKLMHFMRAMEYTDNQAQLVAFSELHNVIGQFPYESPTVFNFYLADFELPGMPEPEPEPEMMGADGMMEPEPEPESAVGPEFQILTPGYMVGYLNGMTMLLNQGVSSYCEHGTNIGMQARNVHEDRWYHVCPMGTMTWKERGGINLTVNQLDLLLTGGRLSNASKDIVRAVYTKSSPGESLKRAQQAITMMPEFNTMGPTLPRAAPRVLAIPQDQVSASNYKAVVMLYLAGGADSWNMLVPRGCALQDEYMQVRTDLALQNHESMEVTTSGQVCEKFGIHSSLRYIKSLYDAGEAAWASNVGALVEPMTMDTYRTGEAQKCMGLFSHSDQTNAAQTLRCQDGGTTARGTGGRIADAISADDGFATTSFSMAGVSTWSRGIMTEVEMVEGDGTTLFHDYEEWREVLSNITMQTHGNAYSEAYTQALFEAIDSTEYLGKVMNSVELKTNYATSTGLQREFKQVAQLITAREGRKAERDFFYVTIGGWDHHSNMKNGLAGKLNEVNGAVEGFVKEMKAQGIWDNIVVFTESEFGRTLDSNGGGSDHAWAGQHWVAGGSVKGGRVVNKYPAAIHAGSPRDLGRGRMIPEFPWESMMVPIAKWMGMQDTDAATVFPNLHYFNSTHIIDDLFE